MKKEPYKTLIYEPGKITRFIHDEPEKRNVTTGTFILELNDALRKFERDPEAIVGVFTSTGPVFCAGHNLEYVSEMEEWKGKESTGSDVVPIVKAPSTSEHPKMARRQATEEDWRKQMDFMRYVHYLPLWDCLKPLVVGVQGGAYAGGVFFTQMFDIVVASEDAFFDYGVSHMSGASGDAMLGLYGNWRKAMEIALTGWNFDAQEAQRIGLVTKVVPKEQLEAECLRYAEIICRMRPHQVKLGKMGIKTAMNRLGARDFITLGYEWNILAHLEKTEVEDEFYKIVKTKGMKAATDFVQKPFEDLGYSRFGPSGKPAPRVSKQPK
jgi:enoyl-CoA hydratase